MNIFKQIRRIRPILIAASFLLPPSVAHADVIWPALYVVNSHFRFWYVIIVGLVLEAAVLKWLLIPDLKKALVVSLVANAFSATVGIYLLAFGMLGWHFIADNNIAGGTFASFNKVATVVLMLFGSAFIETLVTRLIWKYSLRQIFPIFILGNILSYGFIVADLFVFGGWNRLF
jgi:hypothetical protein